jgi:hypothetical protein
VTAGFRHFVIHGAHRAPLQQFLFDFSVRGPPRQHFGILAMNSLALAAICSGV